MVEKSELIVRIFFNDKEIASYLVLDQKNQINITQFNLNLKIIFF